MNRILVGIAILVLGSCGVRKDNDSIEYTEETVDAISGATEITVETEYEDENLIVGRLVYHASETILTDLIHTKFEVHGVVLE